MQSVRAYRALTRVYPSRFRRDYGAAMTQAFADRARVDGSRAAWRVALRDLAVSAPREHREVLVRASMQTKLVVAAIATTVAIVAFAAVGGALFALALMLLLAWELTAILRARGHSSTSVRWWKLSIAGVALFALLFVVFAMPWPEEWRSSVDGEIAWFVGMFGFSASIVLVVLGAMLGLAGWVGRRHEQPAA